MSKITGKYGICECKKKKILKRNRKISWNEIDYPPATDIMGEARNASIYIKKNKSVRGRVNSFCPRVYFNCSFGDAFSKQALHSLSLPGSRKRPARLANQPESKSKINLLNRGTDVYI